MKSASATPQVYLKKTLLCGALGLLAAFPSAAQEAKLPLVTKGASSKLGYYIPQRAKFSEARPAGLKKAPEDLGAPLFGEIKMGPKESPTSILLILDEPEGKPWRLFVDSNGNGDLTDDPPADWKTQAVPEKDGKSFKQSSGGAEVSVKYGDEVLKFYLSMYRFDKSDPRRAQLKDSLLYFRDYARIGELKIGEKSYKAMLSDEMAAGDFRGSRSEKNSGVSLLLDLNGDGKYAAKGERFDASKPFNIGGTTYELADLTASGGSFKVVQSKESVDEIKPPQSLVVGKNAIPFDAKTIDGNTVHFPTDYKGKIVMLDFWATWCGPCIAELPNVVANYEKFHGKGFEVLGITLDNPKAEAKVTAFTKEHKMSWPQIYDGKGWQAAVAQLYDVDSIPRALLVDGDTGKILAVEDSVRGPNLAEAIEKALKGKGGK